MMRLSIFRWLFEFAGNFALIVKVERSFKRGLVMMGCRLSLLVLMYVCGWNKLFFNHDFIMLIKQINTNIWQLLS